MERTELLQALGRLKVETGSLACLGCGYEHNCGTRGCAIIRAAVEALTALTPPNEWVSVEDAMPPELKMVLVYSCGLYDVAGWVKDEHGEICWTCKTVPEFWRPISEME